jgi:class 3 adenylate cyclase
MYVDMVQSTKMTCQIGDSGKIRLFYEKFINTISEIAIVHGARIVKNGGDSIICYFPATRERAEKSTFKDVLNCGLEIIRARETLNSAFASLGLPATSYRVSADYGKHEVAKDQNSEIVDIFGPTMCLCAKINNLSPPNSLLVGSDLYEIVKAFPEYSIHNFGEYIIQERHQYPVFLVFRKV